ncbi:hypothetical protein GCM10010295_63580 [Streptomyces intermedius]|nr:hypothetical protein CWE27_31290 [Streptomyces sp. EAG2]
MWVPDNAPGRWRWACARSHERLKQAAAAMPPDMAAQPFLDALTDLVQAQADTAGFVVLRRWAEILERHFPPQLPDPEHTTE